MLFALAQVHAQEVSPNWHDFGDVEVLTSVSTIIAVTNVSFFPLEITQIELISGSGDFSLNNPPIAPFDLIPGEPIDIEVVFTPTTEGVASANLIITNGQTTHVGLLGNGVATIPPSTIVDILNFFDESVADGTLVGAGSGNSADGRLNALRNMLIQASYLLSAGNLGGACTQLSAALQRCNDFVQGTAQNDLKQMISEVMYDLGC